MSIRSAFIATLSGVLSIAVTVSAAVPGHVDDFPAGVGDWNGGASAVWVSTGGVGGGGDGFLSISRNGAQLGVKVDDSSGGQFVGNLTGDGVIGFSFWLNDVGADEDIEIHVGLGESFSNFWLSVDGFDPPNGTWAEFSVDITDASGWVQIMGSGTFAQAVANSDRLLFRHDVPPLGFFPADITGDFGLDRVTALPAACSAPELMPGEKGVSFAARAFDGYIDPARESSNGVDLNQGLSTFIIELSGEIVDTDGSPLSADSFTITDTDGTPPSIDSVSTDGNKVTITLSQPISVGQRTTIALAAGAACDSKVVVEESIVVGFLPADVNQDGCVSPFDLLRFRQYVSGAAAPKFGLVVDFVDIDRSGGLGPFDLLSFRQLVNGVSPATQEWAGNCLP